MLVLHAETARVRNPARAEDVYAAINAAGIVTKSLADDNYGAAPRGKMADGPSCLGLFADCQCTRAVYWLSVLCTRRAER